MIAMKLPDVAGALGATARDAARKDTARKDTARIVTARKDATLKVATRTTVERVTIDSRRVEKGDLFVALRGERFDGHAFVNEAAARGAVACVVEQGASLGETDEECAAPLLVVDDTVKALGRLASHYRRHVLPSRTRVIGITGSNGKTTTKRMLDHVMAAQWQGRCAPRSFNNAIGLPLSILDSMPGDEYLVLELGTNAPGEIAGLAAIAAPDVAVITSIGEAHLERLGDVRGVAREKADILRYVTPEGLAFVNADRPEILPYLRRFSGRRLTTFGFDDNARLRVRNTQVSSRRTEFDLDDATHVTLGLPGRHHAANAAVVFGIAVECGMAPRTVLQRLAGFEAAEGRACRHELGGRLLIDDAYNANPASMCAAIESLSACATGKRWLVMGDMLELGRFTEDLHRKVIENATAAGVEQVVVVGTHMHEAHRALGSPGNVRPARDWQEAGDVLLTESSPGDAIWVKGSRGMALDRLVTVLRERWSVATGVEPASHPLPPSSPPLQGRP